METQLVSGGPLKEFKREDLLQRLSGSWKGRSIFALLELPRFQKSPREIAPELGITLDQLFFYLDLLEAVSLVKRDASGGYQRLVEKLDFRSLGLDKNEELRNFSLVTAEMLSRQSFDVPCHHESAIVYSNRELVKALIGKIGAAMDEFELASKQSSKKDFLLGVTTAFVDLIESKKMGSEQ